MVRKKNQSNWWLSGRLGLRLSFFGACLGVIGALLFHVYVVFGHINPSSMVWGVAFLVVLEIPLGVAIGLAVSGAVLLVRMFLPAGMERDTNSAIFGLAAFLVQSTLIFALFSVFPWGGVANWAAAVITGPVVGSIYAMFLHARPDQVAR